MKQTALITGAAKRIGKALSEHLAEKGWNIAIHYNNSEKDAHDLATDFASKYPNQSFKTFKADLSDTDEVLKLIPSAISEMGEIQLLINNASAFDKSYIKDTSLKLFERQINVNFRSCFFLIREFAKQCKQGNIINFVDTRITTNKSDFAAYSLSKKVLWELTKMAALEFAPNIRVNAIAPGVTLAPEDKDEKYLQKLAQNIPMKKPGGLIPVLQSLDYILESNQLTGQLLFADGGENLGKNK